jgi:hypothetical protein
MNTYVNNDWILKEMTRLTEMKGKSSTGMEENIAGLLTYVLGLLTGIILAICNQGQTCSRVCPF